MKLISRKGRPSRVKPDSRLLYIIGGASLYKIGIATDISDRLSSLQIGSPLPLRLLFLFEHPDAVEIEKYLHTELHEFHSHGEWFRLSFKLLCHIGQFIDHHWPNGVIHTPGATFRNGQIANVSTLSAKDDQVFCDGESLWPLNDLEEHLFWLNQHPELTEDYVRDQILKELQA